MEWVTERLLAIQKEIKTNGEEMKAKIKTSQEEMKAHQEKMETQMDVNQEKMETAIKSSQEEMKAAINSMRSELEETIKKSGGARPDIRWSTDTVPSSGTPHEDGRNAAGLTNVPRYMDQKSLQGSWHKEGPPWKFHSEIENTEATHTAGEHSNTEARATGDLSGEQEPA